MGSVAGNGGTLPPEIGSFRVLCIASHGRLLHRHVSEILWNKLSRNTCGRRDQSDSSFYPRTRKAYISSTARRRGIKVPCLRQGIVFVPEQMIGISSSGSVEVVPVTSSKRSSPSSKSSMNRWSTQRRSIRRREFKLVRQLLQNRHSVIANDLAKPLVHIDKFLA